MSHDLTELLKTDEKIKVAGVDIDGIVRGKFLIKDKFIKSLDNGFGKDRW
jgi:glutamine synthetase